MRAKKKSRDLLPGEVLTITAGSYSDYEMLGCYKVKERFNPDLILQKIKPLLKEKQDGEYDHNFTASQYVITEFIKMGLLKPIQYQELWLGDGYDLSGIDEAELMPGD